VAPAYFEDFLIPTPDVSFPGTPHSHCAGQASN
jgi:hypothetical protein